MHPRVRVLILLLASFALTHAATLYGQAAWRQIRVQMTEAELLRTFGPPVAVEMFFEDVTALREGRSPPSGYRFKYMSGTRTDELAIDGPLGEAETATVRFSSDRVVTGVDWIYSFGVRSHTRTGEAPTPITRRQIEALANGAAITVQRFSANVLSQRAAPEDAGRYQFNVGGRQMWITYLGPGSDVLVEMR